eukprot:g10225.t1
MTNALVTGGAGFIGSHIATRLMTNGHRVRILDNLSTGSRSNIAHLGSDVELIEGSVADAEAVSEALDGVEVVFHQAALASVPRSIEHPLDTHEACVTGTLTLLDAARRAGVRRVVYAASSSAYGDQPQMPKTESQRPSVLSPYAAAKLAGELYLQSFAHSYGIETVSLRYFNVFGPRQDPDSPYSAVIPLFAKSLLTGGQPTIFGDGEQSRDFTHIDNVVHANMLAATAEGVSGNVYNVACGTSYSLLQLLMSLCLQVFQAILDAGLSRPFSRQDVAVNLLAGVPLSFAIAGTVLFRERRWLQVVPLLCVALAVSISASCVAEFGQVWVENRVPSVRDIAAQSVGAVVGLLCWLLFNRRLVNEIDTFLTSRERATRFQAFLNLYVAGFFVWSLMPFDLVTSVNELGQKLVNGQIEIRPFTFPYPTRFAQWHALLMDTLIYLPVGIWASYTSLRKETRIRNACSAMTLAILFSVGVEASQLLINGRYSSTTDVLCGAAGALIGIGLTAIVTRRTGPAVANSPRAVLHDPGFWALTTLVYSAVVIAIFWMPIEELTHDSQLIRSRLREFVDVPFRRMQTSSSDLGIVFALIRNFAWFVPLGVLCAVTAFRTADTPLRRKSLLFAGFLFLATIGLTIEAGQILMPNRFADVTEVLIRLVGGIAGLFLGSFLMRKTRSQETTST